MQNTAVRELAEKVALELLERDGMPVIWLLQLTAAKAQGDGQRRAAETLLEIADAAERCSRLAGIAGARWQPTAPSTKINVPASEMKAAKFCAVFSQRKAMRLKRLNLPTPCSARARPL